VACAAEKLPGVKKAFASFAEEKAGGCDCATKNPKISDAYPMSARWWMQ
jgi:hypothetical protein